MTYRGLPADYDAWKTRSDRDDQPMEDDVNDQYAKEIEAALNHDLKADFPNARLGLKPSRAADGQPQPTASQRIEVAIVSLQAAVAEAQALIEGLRVLQSKL